MQLITEKAPEPPRERPPASQFRQLSRNAFGVEETPPVRDTGYTAYSAKT
jgi:hypothetical protein